MLSTLKLEIAVTESGLLEARAQIDMWLRIIRSTESEGSETDLGALQKNPEIMPISPGTTSSQTSPQDFVDDLWTNIGVELRRMLYKAANEYKDMEPFDLKQIALDQERDIKTIKAWIRTLGRAMSHGTDVFDREWDPCDGQMFYRWKNGMREAILSKSDPT